MRLAGLLLPLILTACDGQSKDLEAISKALQADGVTGSHLAATRVHLLDSWAYAYDTSSPEGCEPAGAATAGPKPCLGFLLYKSELGWKVRQMGKSGRIVIPDSVDPNIGDPTKLIPLGG